MATQIWSDPRYERNFRTLIDLSQATLSLYPAELREHCQWLNQSTQSLQGRTALVASRPVETALGLMLQNGLRPYREVAVFSTIAAAESFLAEASMAADAELPARLAPG